MPDQRSLQVGAVAGLPLAYRVSMDPWRHKAKDQEEFLSHRAHDARARARARAHFAVASAPARAAFPAAVVSHPHHRRLARRGVTRALSVLACSRIDPGISHEKAEAILRAFDFTDIELPPSPEGWSGTAVPASGGYRIRATLPDGVLKPFARICDKPVAERNEEPSWESPLASRLM